MFKSLLGLGLLVFVFGYETAEARWSAGVTSQDFPTLFKKRAYGLYAESQESFDEPKLGLIDRFDFTLIVLPNAPIHPARSFDRQGRTIPYTRGNLYDWDETEASFVSITPRWAICVYEKLGCLGLAPLAAQVVWGRVEQRVEITSIVSLEAALPLSDSVALQLRWDNEVIKSERNAISLGLRFEP